MLHVIAKVLILSVFLFSGMNKLLHFKKTYHTIKKKNIPYPILATIGAIVFELLGVFLVFFSYPTYNVLFFLKPYYGILGCILLIIFTLLATYYYHNILNDFSEKYNFLKNLAIIGGLLLLLRDYI